MQKPNPDASARTGYGANPLDRLANSRDDATFVAGLRAAPGTRHLVFTGDIPLLRQRGTALDPFFSGGELASLGSARETALLGQDEAGAIFATRLDEAAPESGEGDSGHVSLDLRSLAVQGLLAPPLLGVMAQAKSILHWHARHRFCAHCGAPTQAAAAGWKRLCGACSAQHFPRTDPVVIMLVIDGDSCLVGRQPQRPGDGLGVEHLDAVAPVLDVDQVLGALAWQSADHQQVEVLLQLLRGDVELRRRLVDRDAITGEDRPELARAALELRERVPVGVLGQSLASHSSYGLGE